MAMIMVMMKTMVVLMINNNLFKERNKKGELIK